MRKFQNSEIFEIFSLHSRINRIRNETDAVLKTTLVIIFLFLSLVSLSADEIPAIIEIDCSLLSQNQVFTLNGNWYFYPEQFLVKTPESPGQTISVPSAWRGRKNRFRYGTYYTKIHFINGKAPGNIVLQMKEIRSAYTIFINGEKYLSSGEPGIDLNSEKPAYSNSMIPLEMISDNNEIEILIHVSNYNSHTGGILKAPEIGSANRISSYSRFQTAIQYLLTGFYLAIALYHFLFFLNRQQEKVFLYFAVFTFLIGFRLIILDIEQTGFSILLPVKIPYEIIKKLEFMTFLPSFCFFMLFFDSFFENPGWKKMVPLVILITVFFTIFIIVFPYHIYTLHTRFYQFIILAGSLYCLVIVVSDSLKRKRDSILFLVSLIILITAYIIDIAEAAPLLLLPEILPFGFLGFIIIQAYLVSRRFSFALNRIEDLTEDLNRLLRERKKTMKQLERRVNAKTLEYQNAVEEAEQANKAKGNFLARMSHEIRTPLNGVMGFAEIIQDTKNESEKIHYSRLIISESEKLLRLINQLLDISKIEAGKMVLEKKNFILNDIINSLYSFFASQAKNKNLDLHFRIPEKEIPVNGDPNLLRQVISNLLENSLKFTEKGSISLEISITQETETRISLMFVTSDTGIGIPEEKQSSIFSEFEQGDSSITRKYGGSGLGTTISKDIIEAMGSSIELKSTPGEGTIVWFELTLEKAKLEKIKTKKIKRPSGNKKFRNKRVLVAEDYLANQIIVKKHLESVGFNVDILENGRDAVKAFQKNKYDLVCLDIHMPVMDGYTAARLIRQFPDGNEIPIIGLTADAYPETLTKSKKAGINEILTKPLKKDLLISLIERLVK